jgi:hypothetical protein
VVVSAVNRFFRISISFLAPQAFEIPLLVDCSLDLLLIFLWRPVHQFLILSGIKPQARGPKAINQLACGNNPSNSLESFLEGSQRVFVRDSLYHL